MEDGRGEMDEGPFANETIPAILSGAQKRLVFGQNGFAIDAYKLLAKGNAGFCFSPASIWFLLGILRSCTAGVTADEIAEVLAFPTQSSTQTAIGELLKISNFESAERKVRISNGLWFEQTLPLNLILLEQLERDFLIEAKPIYFSLEPDETRLAINLWVANRTNNLIPNLLQPGNVTAQTQLTLVNAFYFKATWRYPFGNGEPDQCPFHCSDGSIANPPIMSGTMRLHYLRAEGFQAVKLPYYVGETEMVVILPDRRDGLAAVESQLDFEGVANLFLTLDEAEVVSVAATLPKFRMSSRFEVGEILSSLGIRHLLGPDADFSPITSAPLAENSVLHEAFIEINESGTEAAAATVLVERSMHYNPIIFRADHPFLYMIRDQRTGMILFMGRYTGEGSE